VQWLLTLSLLCLMPVAEVDSVVVQTCAFPFSSFSNIDASPAQTKHSPQERVPATSNRKPPLRAKALHPATDLRFRLLVSFLC
jgi:hypothetical protein